jgi:hypothetical protein
MTKCTCPFCNNILLVQRFDRHFFFICSGCLFSTKLCNKNEIDHFLYPKYKNRNNCPWCNKKLKYCCRHSSVYEGVTDCYFTSCNCGWSSRTFNSKGLLEKFIKTRNGEPPKKFKYYTDLSKVTVKDAVTDLYDQYGNVNEEEVLKEELGIED